MCWAFFFSSYKGNLNLNQNLGSSLHAWIGSWNDTYATPKSLVKSKGSQTVGHTPLMLNKHLASKQRANRAQKSEYLVYQFLLQSGCECGNGCTKTELTERKKKYFQGAPCSLTRRTDHEHLPQLIEDLCLIFIFHAGASVKQLIPHQRFFPNFLNWLQCDHPVCLSSESESLLA